MNMQQKPFDDPQVRHAIDFAINKEAFGKVVLSVATPARGVVPKAVDSP